MLENPRTVLVEGLASHWLAEFSAHPEKLRILLLEGHPGLNRLFTPDLMAKVHAEGLAQRPRLAEALSALAATPDSQVIRWRTRWSSGPSEWDTDFLYFSNEATPATIEEAVLELGDREGAWSEHYRGTDWEDITADVYLRAANSGALA